MLTDLKTGKSSEVKKQNVADFRTLFAKFSIRKGEDFIVKEGADFYIPGDTETRWTLKRAGEETCIIRAGETETALSLSL